VEEVLRDALSTATSVRFLCTGNMVRSAFAELYARHLGCALPVDSAATVYQNDGLYPETARELLARGVDRKLLAGFQPRRLDLLPADEIDPAEGLPGARLVLGMTPEHLDAYRARFQDRDRLFLLSELVGSSSPIADPVLDGAAFGPVFAQVAQCVETLNRLL
jgi:protein-tyrosine-phosphatase